MKGKVKMSGVDESGVFKPIPEGIYYVKITEVQDGMSKNDDPMIAVKFTITQGEYKGQWLWDNIILSDNPDSPGFKILGRTKHFLHIIGEPYEDEIVEWDSDNWMGADLRVRVYHEIYQGKPKAKIAEYLFLADTEDDSKKMIDDSPF